MLSLFLTVSSFKQVASRSPVQLHLQKEYECIFSDKVIFELKFLYDTCI
jgi:hypothetical protein